MSLEKLQELMHLMESAGNVLNANQGSPSEMQASFKVTSHLAAVVDADIFLGG